MLQGYYLICWSDLKRREYEMLSSYRAGARLRIDNVAGRYESGHELGLCYLVVHDNRRQPRRAEHRELSWVALRPVAGFR